MMSLSQVLQKSSSKVHYNSNIEHLCQNKIDEKKLNDEQPMKTKLNLV